MKQLLRVSLGALCMVLVATLAACAPDESAVEIGTLSDAQSARILVTTDFGKHVVLDALVTVSPGSSAMDVLAQVANIDTSYGGGFVEGINGIGTGVSGRAARVDWFYSVNGFTARTGAANYWLHDGDMVHWDYRDWSFRRNVTATLGSFPAAFSRGYAGETRATTVVYGDDFESQAKQLALVLQSTGVDAVKVVSLQHVNGEILRRDNIVLVALPEATLVQEVNESWDRLGLFAHLDGRTLHTYGAGGDSVGLHSASAAVILALQNPWNPSGTGACESVAIVITGCDKESVAAAAHILGREYTELSRFAGAVVQGDSWVALP
ncbi:MAG TPA: DUF4430 domain-containing protein [Dehalococcoidia bacterium]|nr:DUF4430 domain-containing protein [Dehalococcoidia bacterium]